MSYIKTKVIGTQNSLPPNYLTTLTIIQATEVIYVNY